MSRIVLIATLALWGAPLTADDFIVWRTDYNTARAEAREKGLPLLIVVGSENCMYCKKQDATTFREKDIVATIQERLIAVKIDGTVERGFVQALKIEVYPTTVFAAPDGKIVGFLQGYVSADQFRDQAKRTILNSGTPDWMARDLEEANKAIALSDYPRAVTLLKHIMAEATDSPAKTKAGHVLAELEKSAAEKLAHAKRLEASGESTAAAESLVDLVRNHAGTKAASDATILLGGTSLAKAGERLRLTTARDLLASAREDFRAKKYADCLDKCDQLTRRFANTTEGKEGMTLAESVKNDPDRLAAACDQLDERAAEMQLALAESWLKKGQTREAAVCLEKVIRLTPNSRTGELAQGRLVSLQRGREVPAVTVGFEKRK